MAIGPVGRWTHDIIDTSEDEYHGINRLSDSLESGVSLVIVLGVSIGSDGNIRPSSSNGPSGAIVISVPIGPRGSIEFSGFIGLNKSFGPSSSIHVLCGTSCSIPAVPLDPMILPDPTVSLEPVVLSHPVVPSD